MSTSLPSKTVFAVDVPEVKNFTVSFRYNFFTPDEKVNENSAIPIKFLARSSGETDSQTIQFFESRVPRHVIFNWGKPRISDVGNAISQSDVNKMAHPRSRQTIISDNYSKIISEDHFSALTFVSVNFHDGDMEEKVYSMVAGSCLQRSLGDGNDGIVNPVTAKNISLESESIDPSQVSRAMSSQNAAYGASYYDTRFNKPSSQAEGRTPTFNTYYDHLKDVYVNVQINSKFFHDITKRSINDPHSPFSKNLKELVKSSKKISLAANQRLGQGIHENEFKSIVPYIDVKVSKVAHHEERKPAEIVGYIIDKFEITGENGIKQLPSIIIENPEGSLALDSSVKYGQRYCYAIRTIAKFYLPAIDSDTGDVATIQVLISSKPVKQYVTIVDNTAPPVPTDINFTWDYEVDKLLIHWTFPPNHQRDIKRFQVFRRATINDSFELIKEYDFDDSAIRAIPLERPNPSVVKRVRSPVTFYIDDDFKKNSKYIYTICSIDAHGLTSNYGAQFELTFDIFKNQLSKSLVSHSGAPKQYPNLYLPGAGFVDVIRVGGEFSKKATLYFTPEYYQLEDDNNKATRILTTNKTKGYYKFNFINTDNQQASSLTINIDDQVNVGTIKKKYYPAKDAPTAKRNPPGKLGPENTPATQNSTVNNNNGFTKDLISDTI